MRPTKSLTALEQIVCFGIQFLLYSDASQYVLNERFALVSLGHQMVIAPVV
jgi:hypothetical protein